MLLKVKTNVDSPALESRVDRMMTDTENTENTENMYDDEMINGGHPTNQGHSYCGESYPKYGAENKHCDRGTEWWTVVGGWCW